MFITKSIKSWLLAVVAVGILLLPQQALTSDTSSIDYKQLRLFRQVMRIVQKNYVKEVSDKELIQGAIKGMLEALDPHSAFMTPDLFKELQVETKGEFGGLGIEITLDNGILTIVSPIEDTPADKAGLKPGDKITKINGESTKNITLLKAVQKMRGPAGSKVMITVAREGVRGEKDYPLVRAVIHVKSVKKEVLEPGYPYVRIANFQDNTDTDLTGAIESLGEDEGIKGMVLDLRNNPGGLLDQAVKVSNLFIDQGLIVYTDGRVKDQRMEFRATRTGKHYKFKIACLINKGSASASEIVAGALQDRDRAIIFGSKSFGKASVQTIIPLDEGEGLKLTTAYYYTPKGRHIQKTGIHPDVDLEAQVKKQEEEAEQEAKQEAKQEGKQEGKEEKNKQQKSRLLKKYKVDPQHDVVLQKALEWLKSDVSAKDYKAELAQKSPQTIPDTARTTEPPDEETKDE
jgi:carboxyl-terminal processing protease